MTKRLFLIVLTALFVFGVWAGAVSAGFGISPPYVKTAKPIRPGGHFEQRITLLRSTAEETLEAHVQVNAPEISSWISINKGNVFDLPQGQLQVPMIVEVDVPESAEIGQYKGNINIKVSPKKDGKQSGVAIALGARVDIDLTVTQQAYVDFKIRKVDLRDAEVLSGIWDWKIFSYFFYRNKLDMKIENTGNIEAAPSKVTLDVYDLNEERLIESQEDTSIDKVQPFETETVTADFPTDLPPGQYWGRVKIYNDNDIIHKDKAAFTVYAPGKKPGGSQLGVWPWVMLAGLILVCLLVLLVLVKIRIWRHIGKLVYVLSSPLRWGWHRLTSYLYKQKVRFWKWMHQKAARYQDETESGSTRHDRSDKGKEE